MSRQRTDLETSGKTSVVGQKRLDGKWVKCPDSEAERFAARVRHRDSDGVLRDVARFASTKAKARTKLKVAIKNRETPTTGAIRADSAVIDAAVQWLDQVNRSSLSENTKQQYRASYERYVQGSAIEHLTLREINRVDVLERYLQRVADDHGTGSAKTARTVLSGILGLAVRYRALPYNAIREVKPAKRAEAVTSVRDTSRAFTHEEREHLLTVADAFPVAGHADVRDIIWWMAGTGVRISEALGQQMRDIDLETGKVVVRGTKTDSSVRIITLPDWLIARIEQRRDRMSLTKGHLLFPSPGTLDWTKPRDRRNVARVMREVFDAAGYPWATPHTLRRTVATLIDQAGLPISLAADVLGHANPAMTAKAYLGRKMDTSAAAKVL